MKVLITGICGFAGSSIAKTLLESHSNLQIFGLDINRFFPCRYSARLILEGTIPRIQPDAVELAEGKAESVAWEWRVQTRERLTNLLDRVKRMEMDLDQQTSAASEQGSAEERGYEAAAASDWA